MSELPKPCSFARKLAAREICAGTCVTFSDPTVTEAMAGSVDFVWIDTEHNPLSLAAVQGHVMAVKGTETSALVRVPANDPNLIKPVLDLGAHGVIVPLVRTAEDVRRAVAACRYPPDGIRGFGPRRPSGYGRVGGAEYCRAANAAIVTVVQIELADAVANLKEILRVPGLASIVVGPNDLAASLGFPGEPGNPAVVTTIERVLEEAARAGVPAGIAVGDDPKVFTGWIAKGARWVAVAADFILLARAADRFVAAIREFRGEGKN